MWRKWFQSSIDSNWRRLFGLLPTLFASVSSSRDTWPAEITCSSFPHWMFEKFSRCTAFAVFVPSLLATRNPRVEHPAGALLNAQTCHAETEPFNRHQSAHWKETRSRRISLSWKVVLKFWGLQVCEVCQKFDDWNCDVDLSWKITDWRIWQQKYDGNFCLFQRFIPLSSYLPFPQTK